ncbi:MAG: zinc metallopeptidase [Bacteroidia bacterium]|nr:zinc metallopeptidase [Bacteroidia bacterium]
MGGIYLIFIFFALVSWLVSKTLKARLNEFSAIPLIGNINGKEVAEKMLRDNGIYDVKVISTQGQLTDHYNPLTKTVNLSNDVFNGTHLSAAAIAAHECGHAVQHAQAYTWLTMRSRLVPIVSFSSNIVQWILLIGIFTVQIFPQLLLLGIVLFALTTLFAFITLPVEFDASARGLQWLNNAGIVQRENLYKARVALNWAATTYVIAAISSLATLMYYVTIYMNKRRD